MRKGHALAMGAGVDGCVVGLLVILLMHIHHGRCCFYQKMGGKSMYQPIIITDCFKVVSKLFH